MKKKHLNKLLEKQIRKAFNGKEEDLPIEVWKLLEAVNTSYNHFERDRKLLQRAMELSSEEIRQSYEQKIIQAKLQQSNEYLQQFVAVASHDLKAPLRTVTSFTQILKMQLADHLDEETKEYMDFIESGVKGMRTLLEDLTDFAKIGLEQKEKEMVDFNQLFELVIRNLGCSIEESKAEVLLVNPLPVHLTYPYQVTQLFQNIIGNALKFRKENVDPLILISCTQELDKYIISIADNGIGMDQQKHTQAFEAFSRLSNKTNIAGTGLGLSICKKIVDSWGGNIWFDSALGKGTTFFFTIPITAKTLDPIMTQEAQMRC